MRPRPARHRTAAAALLVVAAAGCSEIEGTDGLIALAVAVPTDLTMEIGETTQLAAWGLTADGDSVGIDVDWIAADTTLDVDGTGLVTARFPGPGRVQAQSGTLTSDLVRFTITATPDTLIMPVPAVLDVADGVAGSDPLLPRLETLDPAVPVPGGQITFRVIEPEFPTPLDRTVELTGGVLETTVTTSAQGSPATEVRLLRVPATTQPDSAIVEVTSTLPGGLPVPGSGQRFVVRFH